MHIHNSPIRRDEPWLEAIALFRAAHESNHQMAHTILSTSVEAETVMHHLLRLLSVYLRGESPSKIEHFISASHRAGPPPQTPPPFMP
ncbi:hypothetical protein CIK74_05215 [Glutamicibacter sp. BW77]|nr:hypothetical protein CIK74_05215 [Glutamicibacter sp. BW77]HBV10837.1 hypothetical protein [Micrococcaceae bacterium]